jgi:hypothetical protein
LSWFPISKMCDNLFVFAGISKIKILASKVSIKFCCY